MSTVMHYPTLDRSGCSVFFLPAAKVRWGELVTVFGADLDHAGVVLAATLQFIAKVVVALHPRHERLQLSHGHGDPPEIGRAHV